MKDKMAIVISTCQYCDKPDAECEIIDRHIGSLIFGKGNVTACQKCFQNMYQRKEIIMDIDGNKWKFIRDVESQRKF